MSVQYVQHSLAFSKQMAAEFIAIKLLKYLCMIYEIYRCTIWGKKHILKMNQPFVELQKPLLRSSECYYENYGVQLFLPGR